MVAEIARAAAGPNDEESVPPAVYDVLAVCDYLSIFPAPPSATFFLTIEQQLDVDWPRPLLPREPMCPNLAQVLQQRRKRIAEDVNTVDGLSDNDREGVSDEERPPSDRTLWSIADVLVHDLAGIFRGAIKADKERPMSASEQLGISVTAKGGRFSLRYTQQNVSLPTPRGPIATRWLKRVSATAKKLRGFLMLPHTSRRE